MLQLYKSLSEKDRRHYSAIEANKIGYDGVTYISKVLQCNHEVISRGKIDLLSALGVKQDIESLNDRIRKVGGGRKSIIDITVGIEEAFLKVVDGSTAGSPMDEHTCDKCLT